MANFQVNSIPSWVQYTATQSQTEFSIPFPFINNSDLSVWLNGVLLTLTTDYTLSGANTASGGQLTLNVGANLNDVVTIQDLMVIDRTNIYLPVVSALTGSALNNDFNRDVIMIRDTTTTVNYLMLQYEPWAPISQDINVTTDRIIPLLGANQVWRKDSTNTFIEAVTLPDIPIGIEGDFTTNNALVSTNTFPGPNYVQQTDLVYSGGTLTAMLESLTLTGSNNVNISTPGNINFIPGANLILDGTYWPTTPPLVGQIPMVSLTNSTQMVWGYALTVPGVVQNDHIVRFYGTTGAVQNSLVSIDDLGNVSGALTYKAGNITVATNSVATGSGDLLISASSGNQIVPNDPTEALGIATKQYVDAHVPPYPVTPADGGTGLVSPTAHSLLIAEGASNMNLLALSSNQIIVGNTGADPSAATLGTGVLAALEAGVTGSGNIVLATSPTLVTPNLGTPSTLVGTNITGTASGLTAGHVTTNANLTGDVTSVGNATTLTNSAVIGQNLTGFTSTTGTVTSSDSILTAIEKIYGNAGSTIPNLTGVITSVGTVTSTGSQTGTGSTFVMNTSPTISSPTLTTPVLGTPSSGNLSNCTSLPISTGVSGLGTGVATSLANNLSATPSASTFASWDANSNISANSVISGYATTATAAGTTVLTVSSKQLQNFTGSTTQTVQLPVTSTLVLGQTFTILNSSSGTVTVTSSGGNTVLAMASGVDATFTCVLTSGTTAASWNYTSNSGGGGSGTVNAGTTGQIAYYASNGTAVSGETLVPISAGGTNSSSVTTAPAATAWAGWDANSNMSANNFIGGYATTVAANGTTTLTVSSPQYQFLSGSGNNQTFKMPVASTCVIGQSWVFTNNTPGNNLSIVSSGSSAILTLQPGNSVTVTCILTSGTTAASWTTSAVAFVVPSTNTYIAYYNGTNQVTGKQSVPVANGGTGLTSLTSYAVMCGGTTTTGNVQSIASVGTSGEVLTSNGAGALPTFQPATSTGGFNKINVQTFTSSGTYTPSAGLFYAIIECVGAGGGGGGTASANSGFVTYGGSGGGGAYASQYASAATIGASQTVTIGTGGSGGTAGNNNGTAGGSTSVGSICVAGGGAYGTGNSGTAASAGGAGGTGTTGNYIVPGKAGGIGNYGTTGIWPTGGDSGKRYGSGGVFTSTSTPQTGPAGNGYGGGGCGGVSYNTGAAAAGGVGSGGIVIITEYTS